MNISIIHKNINEDNQSDQNKLLLIHNFTTESKFSHGAYWIKVLHHNASHGYFNSSSVLLNLDPNLFSIMGYIDQSFKYNGKYEMLIECPSSNNGYLWWRQNHFPKLSDEPATVNSVADGLEFSPNTIWKTNSANGPFTGLTRSDHANTFFDGTTKDNHWYFAIGASNCQYENQVPCYEYTSEITLWIRVHKYIIATCGIRLNIQLITCCIHLLLSKSDLDSSKIFS